jgi:hypothetical protein
MKRIVLIIILFLFLCSFAKANSLSLINDIKIIHLLNDMEIIAEIKEPPLAARMIRQDDHG